MLKLINKNIRKVIWKLLEIRHFSHIRIYVRIRLISDAYILDVKNV